MRENRTLMGPMTLAMLLCWALWWPVGLTVPAWSADDDGTTTTSPATADATEQAYAPFVFTGNGYDFVLFVSRARKVEVAVDPEVLADLGNLKVEVTKPSTASGWQGRRRQDRPGDRLPLQRGDGQYALPLPEILAGIATALGRMPASALP